MVDFIARAAWGRADGKYFATTTVNGVACRAAGFETIDACFHELARLCAEALRHPLQHTELSATPDHDTHVDARAFVT